MPFGEQSNKWFSFLILLGLPFFITYKIIKKDLPPLSEIEPKNE